MVLDDTALLLLAAAPLCARLYCSVPVACVVQSAGASRGSWCRCARRGQSEYNMLADTGNQDNNGVAVYKFLHGLGIPRTRAFRQAVRLAEAGVGTRDHVMAMPEQDLRSLAGLVAEDLQLVLAWRQRESLAAADLVLRRSISATKSDTASESSEAHKVPRKSVTLDHSLPDPEAAGGDGHDWQPLGPGSPSVIARVPAVGQTVWVHNGSLSRVGTWVPWECGVVAGYSEDLRTGRCTLSKAYGFVEQRPLVCPTEGRPRDGCRSVRWNAEEASIPHVWQHVRTSPPGWTMKDIQSEFASIRIAAENSRNNCIRTTDGDRPHAQRPTPICEARLSVMATLFFCHLLQPVSYCLSFATAWKLGNLPTEQYILGGCVAAREVLYFVLSVACVGLNPSFFLLDVVADATSDCEAEAENLVPFPVGCANRDCHQIVAGISCIFQYVCMPLHPLTHAVFHSHAGSACTVDHGRTSASDETCYNPGAGAASLGLCWLLDLCAVAALGAGVGAHDLSPALVLSYGTTTVGMISCAGSWVLRNNEHSVARRSAWTILTVQCLTLCLLLFVGFALAEADLASREAQAVSAEIDLSWDHNDRSGSGAQVVALNLTDAVVVPTHYFQVFTWCALLGVLLNVVWLLSLVKKCSVCPNVDPLQHEKESSPSIPKDTAGMASL